MDGEDKDSKPAFEHQFGITDGIHVQQREQLKALLELTAQKGTLAKGPGALQSQICLQLSSLFSSPSHLTAMFSQDSAMLEGTDSQGTPNAAGINFKAVRALHHNIRAMDVQEVSESVAKASERLLEENKLPGASHSQISDGKASETAKTLVSSWLIIFANPLLLEPEYHPLLQSLAKALTSLGSSERALAVSTLSSLPKEDLEEMVATVQQCITVQLYEASKVTEAVQLCTKLLKLLYDANATSRLLPISAFYNDAVNNKDLVDPDRQYQYWRKPQRYAFSFCNYPFILDLATKCRILQLVSHIEMQEQFQRALFHGLFNQTGFIEPYNVMRVRRDHLIHDAITHVQRKKEDLKKQLRVQFIGEDAVDEGGVRKEFFQLVVQELFDPKYGMFSYREQSRQFWFSLQAGELMQIQEEQEAKYRQELQKEEQVREQGGGNRMPLDWTEEFLNSGREQRASESKSLVGDSRGSGETGPGGEGSGSEAQASAGPGVEDLEMRREYELVGMLLGLAIYNSCILEVRFPGVLYNKLLGRPLGLVDLESLDKDLAKGLKDLLQFQGDVQEVFDLNFQVTVEDIFGDRHVVDLVPGGGHIPLTSANRQQYVDACAKFYLNTSIHRQFMAFAKGFKHLVPENVLKLFEPEELELLICGISELDFDDLEKGAHYTDGYTKHHKTIRQFWEIVHNFSEVEKRNLLMFVTGCDRSPIRGLGSLKFTISRNGPDSDRLPTAHTCFNHLLLPEYKSKEKLKDRLVTAINNAKGFGLQ